MNFEKLVKPRLLNPSLLECDLVNLDGSISKISFPIPPEEKTGINEYFDYIVANYHLDEIRATYESELKAHRDRQRHQQLIDQRKKEAQALSQLFDTKAQLFDMPFVKDSSQDLRSAIRRAPDQITLNLIVSHAFEKYLQIKDMSCSDYLDYLDELLYNEETK